MDDFEDLSGANIADLADGLSASADLKEEAAKRQLQTARDMRSIAAIANGMADALADNTETMRKMSADVTGAAERAENASEIVYKAVEERAVKTLRDVDRAARMAVRNSQESAKQAVEELEEARQAMLKTVVTVCVVACLACLVVLIVSVGFMYIQFQAGGAWLGTFGWAAVLLSMAACGALGYFIAIKSKAK